MSRYVGSLTLTLLLGLTLASCGGDESSTQDQQEAQSLLGQQDYAQQLRSEEARGFSFGSFSAPVTVHAFLDFTCQDCREFIRGPFSELRKDHIPNNQVRYIFYGLAEADSTPSGLSMQAALCADNQGVFWAYHDKLFQRQPRWLQRDDPGERLAEYAVQVGLGREMMNDCIERGEDRAQIDTLNELAQQIEADSLPAIFVNGYRLLDNTKLLKAVDQKLQEAQSSADAENSNSEE